MAVSEQERDYLRRLGEFQAQGHEAETAAHLALPPERRLARSVALMRRFAASARARSDDPAPFYARARQLGLYLR